MNQVTSITLPRGLIVSCQGPDGTPLDNPIVMGAMAWAAEAAGAIAILSEIAASYFAQELVSFPITPLVLDWWETGNKITLSNWRQARMG